MIKEKNSKLGCHIIDIDVSRIGDYYKCSRFYFLKHILKVRQNKRIDFNEHDCDHLVLKILNKYFKYYPKFDIEEVIIDIINNYFYSNFEKIYKQNEIEFKIHKNVKKISSLLSNNKEMFNIIDDFRPKYFGISINKVVFLSDKHAVNIKGVIDRIDYNINSNEYRIVNYNFQNEFLNNLYYGLNFKLFLGVDFCNDNNMKILDIINYNIKDIKNKCINIIESKYFTILLKYSDMALKKIFNNIIIGSTFNNVIMLKKKELYCENCVYNSICTCNEIDIREEKKFKIVEDVFKFMDNKIKI